MRRAAGRRWLIVAAASFASLTPSGAHAQRRVAIDVRRSYVPLYEGDAAVGPSHGWGVTTQAAVTLDSLGALEVSGFYTVVPRGDEPTQRTPRIQMAGVVMSVSRGIESSLTAVGTVGFGLIQYSPHEVGACEPPLCFAEGGGSYARARHATFIGGLGVEGAVTPRWRLRLDVKEHLPIGLRDAPGDTGERRTDIGFGIRFLVR